MSILLKYSRAWQKTLPKVWESVHLSEPGLRGVFYEGVPHRGRETRNFAWIGLPAGASRRRPVPAMVLIHGGGGTAFARWVRWWNQRGYAAIAMDTCGAMPLPDTGLLGSAAWPRYSFSGPAGWGGFDQIEAPPQDQWAFHACAAVVRAHTLLASLPEVDAGRIGLTGISWGGFLTCLVAGVDPRFRFAAPVYGCGFIQAGSAWSGKGGELGRRSPAQQRAWCANWDPSAVLGRVRCPMLWLNGTNDFAYLPPIWQRSAAATRGPRQMCLKLRWPHGHIPAAEQVPEIAAFADAHLRGGAPLLAFGDTCHTRGALCATLAGDQPVRAAWLQATVADGPWPEREWHVLPASFDPVARTVTARLPTGFRAATLAVTDERWLTTTSDVVFP